MKEPEVWKKIPGYKYHCASSNGRIKALDRKIVTKNGKVYKKPGRVLKQTVQKSGYLAVSIYRKGQRKTIRAHRLVALAFLGQKKQKTHVNHKDGVKSNNNSGNLEWVSNKENARHAIDAGLTGRVVYHCVERDIYFYGLNPAARFAGRSITALTTAINQGHKCGGYTWRKVGRRKIAAKNLNLNLEII